MTADAIASFAVVISALKSLAESVVSKNLIRFAIQEGSASCKIEAEPLVLDEIYAALDSAIQGECRNSEVTSNLRKIQDEVKRSGFAYGFQYRKADAVFDIEKRLVAARRISLKRAGRDLFHYEFKIVGGIVNQIGGINPNYHIDLGNGLLQTIECSKADAISVNQFLYKNVNAITLSKIWENPEKRANLVHKAVVDPKFVSEFSAYFDKYNSETDLVTKLGFTHDFVDELFENSGLAHLALATLLQTFNDKALHLSELKTMLVASKPLKAHPIIQKSRIALLATYESMRE